MDPEPPFSFGLLPAPLPEPHYGLSFNLIPKWAAEYLDGEVLAAEWDEIGPPPLKVGAFTDKVETSYDKFQIDELMNITLTLIPWLSMLD